MNSQPINFCDIKGTDINIDSFLLANQNRGFDLDYIDITSDKLNTLPLDDNTKYILLPYQPIKLNHSLITSNPLEAYQNLQLHAYSNREIYPFPEHDSDNLDLSKFDISTGLEATLVNGSLQLNKTEQPTQHFILRDSKIKANRRYKLTFDVVAWEQILGVIMIINNVEPYQINSRTTLNNIGLQQNNTHTQPDNLPRGYEFTHREYIIENTDELKFTFNSYGWVQLDNISLKDITDYNELKNIQLLKVNLF